MMLVLDRSESITEMGATDDVRQTAMRFVNLLDAQRDQIGLVVFNHTAQTVQGLTSNLAQLHPQINAIQFTGGTNIGLAINNATLALSDRQRRSNIQPVLILLTDGILPTAQDRQNAIMAADRAKEAGIRLVTIGFGAANQELLSQLASPGGENTYYVANATDLDLIYQQVYEAISVHEACPINPYP
jgi:Mg-chelatase subunit ChlD